MKDLTKLTLTDLWKEVKEDFWEEISLQTQKMVKKLMETTLEEEMAAYIGIGGYGRSENRRGYRNGYYTRGLLTSFGYMVLSPYLCDNIKKFCTFGSKGFLAKKEVHVCIIWGLISIKSILFQLL